MPRASKARTFRESAAVWTRAELATTRAGHRLGRVPDGRAARQPATLRRLSRAADHASIGAGRRRSRCRPGRTGWRSTSQLARRRAAERRSTSSLRLLRHYAFGHAAAARPRQARARRAQRLSRRRGRPRLRRALLPRFGARRSAGMVENIKGAFAHAFRASTGWPNQHARKRSARSRRSSSASAIPTVARLFALRGIGRQRLRQRDQR